MQTRKILVYFLIVFLAFSFISLVYAVPIFQDDFELTNGFGGWTGTAGSPTIATNPVHHNTNSCLLNAEGEYVYKTLTGISEVWMRYYLQYNTVPGNDEIYYFSGLHYSSNYYLSHPVLKELDGSYYWGLEFRKVGAMQIVYEAVASNPTVNTWYCVEVYYKANTAASNGAKLWIDGELIAINDATTQNTNVDQARIRWDSSASTVPSMYVDCVVVDAAYIGPEGGTVTEYAFQGNFNPTFTFGSTREWSFETYRTMPFAFGLNHLNTFSFSNLHTFSVSFSIGLNRFVNLNTQNTFGLAFTLNQLRTWQFASYRTIPFQLALNSIQNFAYSLPGLLTFYGDITATFTMKALKEAGFTLEQTIPFTLGIQSATTILQLGILTIWSSIGFTFQTLSSQYGLAEITLDYAFALAGLAFILAITGITITLVRRKGD